MKRINIIDSTALYYMGGAYYVLWYFRKISKKQETVIPVFDISSPYKKLLVKSYKEKRTHEQKDNWQDYKFVVKLSKYIYPVFYKKGIEADEIIATLSFYYTKLKNYDDIVIHTVDGDLYQLVNDKIKIYNIRKKKEINIKNFKRITKYDIETFILKKILTGDKSDNIKGIITEKKFDKIFIEKDTKELEKFERTVIENLPIVMQNAYLIRLWPNFALLDWIEQKLKDFKPDYKAFKKAIIKRKDKRLIDFVL